MIPICRRCGEPDRRGSARNRRRRREVMLSGGGNSIAGNGQLTVCVWCGDLLGAVAGGIEIEHPTMTSPGVYLRYQRMEQDRLERGGPYALWNVCPACPDCNRFRNNDGKADEMCPPLENFTAFYARTC